MRVDIQESTQVNIVRPSASTQATSATNSSQPTHNKPSNTASDVGQEVEVHNLLIVDQHTFEILHSHTLMTSEYAMSLISTKLGEDPTPYYIVGTALISPDESEPKMGRILLYNWNDGKLTQVYKFLLFKKLNYYIHSVAKQKFALSVSGCRKRNQRFMLFFS